MIKLIACIGKNFGIGADGDLLYKLKSDLRLFNALTTDQVVVMGKKTYQSLPQGPLKDRLNIVVTHQEEDLPGALVVHSFDELRQFMAEHKELDYWIIGGASLYNEFIGEADQMVLTWVDLAPDKEADTFFPAFDHRDFTSIHLRNIPEGFVMLYQRLENH